MVVHVYVNQLFSRQNGTLPSSIAIALHVPKIIKRRKPSCLATFRFLGSQFQIDSPMRPEDWQKRGMLSHFTVMRKLEGSIFPIGLAKEASDRNQKAGSSVLALESRWVLPFSIYITRSFEGLPSLKNALFNCSTPFPVNVRY